MKVFLSKTNVHIDICQHSIDNHTNRTYPLIDMLLDLSPDYYTCNNTSLMVNLNLVYHVKVDQHENVSIAYKSARIDSFEIWDRQLMAELESKSIYLVSVCFYNYNRICLPASICCWFAKKTKTIGNTIKRIIVSLANRMRKREKKKRNVTFFFSLANTRPRSSVHTDRKRSTGNIQIACVSGDSPDSKKKDVL